jgi:glycosyltransferase involved in cell wall biosynthesis
MKVCGFSFVRNGVRFDYPFKEALLSIVPICDEIIVAVGKSDDTTLEEVRSLHPKIKVIETVWDDSLKEGGKVYAAETNKAFQSIPAEYDWAFYIQGDEVVHEKYLPAIKKAMEDNLQDSRVDGLLFNYLHFYGSYDYVGAKHTWYGREIRIIRNRKDIYSFKDAQGFRKDDDKKLQVKLIDAYIYHYGWVREPNAMLKKIASSETLYRGGEIDEKKIENKQFEYDKMEEPVTKFTGTHPQVMQARVKRKNWNFKPDPNYQYASLKDWFKRTVGKLTGWIPFDYKNYKIIK